MGGDAEIGRGRKETAGPGHELDLHLVLVTQVQTNVKHHAVHKVVYGVSFTIDKLSLT